MCFPTGLAFAHMERSTAPCGPCSSRSSDSGKGCGREGYSPLMEMARSDPGTYARCLEICLGRKLGGEIGRSVLAGQIPRPDAWRRAAIALRVRRIRTPGRAMALLTRSLTRLAERISHPTGLIVEVVGPDGDGEFHTLVSAPPPLRGVLLEKQAHPLASRPSSSGRGPGRLKGLGPRAASRCCSTRADAIDRSSAVLLAGFLPRFVAEPDPTAYPERPDRRGKGMVGHRYRPAALSDAGASAIGHRTRSSSASTRHHVRSGSSGACPAGRKQEITVGEAERQTEAWREVARKYLRHALVDATLPPSDVQDRVGEVILSSLERRTAARTGPGWLNLSDHGAVRWVILEGHGPRRGWPSRIPTCDAQRQARVGGDEGGRRVGPSSLPAARRSPALGGAPRNRSPYPSQRDDGRPYDEPPGSLRGVDPR